MNPQAGSTRTGARMSAPGLKAAFGGVFCHVAEVPISYGERLGLRLSKKTEQTNRSGAQWLLIDSLDHLWHMTQWSRQSIEQHRSFSMSILSSTWLDISRAVSPPVVWINRSANVDFP